MAKKKLSVVIITLNEERNIGRCLDSVASIADEVVVVDSFSTDRTEEICKAKGARFIQKSWEGYSRTKNFANAQAAYDWILSLDADEALDEKLQKSIQEAKNSNDEFFKINRITKYCGKWIKHCGWNPDIKTRLFNRKSASWEGEFVHEKLVTSYKGHIPLLKGRCLHYSYYSIEQHVAQVNKFSTLAALELIKKDKHFPLLTVLYKPVSKFLSVYFLKKGFLDGYYGFVIAVISAYARFLKYSKAHSMRRQ